MVSDTALYTLRVRSNRKKRLDHCASHLLPIRYRYPPFVTVILGTAAMTHVCSLPHRLQKKGSVLLLLGEEAGVVRTRDGGLNFSGGTAHFQTPAAGEMTIFSETDISTPHSLLSTKMFLYRYFSIYIYKIACFFDISRAKRYFFIFYFYCHLLRFSR